MTESLKQIKDMDWKEVLAKLASPCSENSEVSEVSEVSEKITQRGALHVVVEKKGRGGKTATIVEGFELPDEDVAEIARELKKKLGVGGSSRGGEILIQGERRDDVKDFLLDKGFKIKG